MASLVEELVTVLKEETSLYTQLVPVAEAKTPIIIKNELEELEKITQVEQELVDQITMQEHKRLQIVRNIAIVLGKKEAQIKSKDIIEYLVKEPKEQKELQILHDQLKHTIQKLMEVNNRNKSLINQSLEMIEFNMNFIQSTRMSPGNNNYTKGAVNGYGPTSQTRMFDAKQ
ncbi:MAG: flagellar protein FlgN [bacterium]|nr:flagellar protein FlgN [bacterium]